MSLEENTTIPFSEEQPILPTAADVLACQFSSWYPVFSNLQVRYKGRSNVTIKSTILDLPESFLHYLNTDGLILPANTKTSSVLLEANRTPDWSSDDDEDDEPGAAHFEFEELNAAIDDAITSLGGAVIPKLNWSAPKDAAWVNSGTLECRTAGDVYMLVKSSDFCNFDVNHAAKDVRDEQPANVKFQLALRKFCNLYPSQEFRCFVRNRQMIAISQRHHSQHWPHLAQSRGSIQRVIQDFYAAVVSPIVELEKYTFDIYIDKKERIWLLDLNVWASRTDALLFEWSELQSMTSPSLPVFRVVETAKQVRADPLASYKAPIDTLHVAGSLVDDAKFKEFMGMCKRPSTLDNNSDDSSDGAA